MREIKAGVSDIPSKDRCVIPHIIARRAEENPDGVFAIFEDESTWTNKQTEKYTLEMATGLKRLGVTKGDRVLCWMPSGATLLNVWFGINQLGAIYVPMNLAYKGSILQHIVNITEATVAVVHADLAERFKDIKIGTIKKMVIVDGPKIFFDGIESYDQSVLYPDSIDEDVIKSPSEPWDPYSIIFTSGTTGPSKGVLSSYLHAWNTSAFSAGFLFKPDDRVMVMLPLFHVGGTLAVISALSEGLSFAMFNGFKTDTFWEDVKRTGCTAVTLLGVMAMFLLKQPERPDDKDTPLRLVGMVPLTDDAEVFAKRFGTIVYSFFNMTEINCPLLTEVNPKVVGTCGKPRPGVEVRVVDENDMPVPVGEVGELIVRADMPWSLNSGYWNNPEATAEAWRNGWFHTGDGFKLDSDGNYYFVDRVKDAIRRRGENISTFEVEAELLAYPGIREAAVVAAPSEMSEDEVFAIVAPVEGVEIDPEELLKFLIPRMPHFMLPRYIRIMKDLPKTPTNKVEKYRLRNEGITSDTWDREKAGIIIKRDKIGK